MEAYQRRKDEQAVDGIGTLQLSCSILGYVGALGAEACSICSFVLFLACLLA